MTRKIIVTNSKCTPLVNKGDVMTVVGEHGHGPVDATLDGGDGFVWYMQPGEFEEYVPQEAQKLWRDMTDAEKGALLLAAHEGKDIERHFILQGWVSCQGSLSENFAYRIKPEPKRETVEVWWDGYFHNGEPVRDYYRITFNLIDGKPDTDSIKMETISDQ